MRVLRLPVDGRRIVDLHPVVSVVVDLDPAQAARLRVAVASVASGLAPEGGGLLEAHGLLLDATQADLDLLDAGADPWPGVVSTATLLPGDPHGHGDLRTAERDALLLATDRRWATAALAAARTGSGAGERDLARAEQLRLAVARHDGTDVEPLRLALDADRDACRADPADVAAVPAVADELASLGVDLRRHPVPAAEVRRTAEDLLDEHARHGAWVVGARVELAGIERRLASAYPAPSGRPALPESVERRAERATAAHLDALIRADARRDALAARPSGADVHELGDALVRTLGERGRAHPAGTAPVVVDRVLAGLGADDVHDVLDRVARLARGVQVLVLDDHPAALTWADAADAPVAAVVRPTPAPTDRASPTMRRTRAPGGPHA